MHLRDNHVARGAVGLFIVLAALAATAAAMAASGATERVSVSSSGSQANGQSGFSGRPAISADGNLVAFDSTATNLVPGATSGQDNIYLHSRSSGGIELVSVTPGGSEPNGASSQPDVSADGRYVAFRTFATDLIPGGPAAQIVVYDRFAHTTVPVSVAGKTGADGQNPSISDDGRYVAFQSNNPSLAQGQKPTGNPPYIYVRDLIKQKTVLASVNSAGKPAGDFSENPVISGNGRYVAFQSSFVAGTTNGTSDVFVHDLQTGTTTLVSVDSAGNPANRGDARDPSISSDGRYIAFDAGAQTLVPNDTNQAEDVFVHDMLTGQTTRVSVDGAGNQANDSSDLLTLITSPTGTAATGPQISADGRYVTFESAATNLVAGDTNGVADVFVHDLQAGATVRASLDSGGAESDGPSSDPAIDADGSAIAFLSAATNLVPNDTNAASDIFVHIP